MSIERFFTTTFTVTRHVFTGDSSALVSQGTFDGHIQQASPSTIQEYQSLRLTKPFIIWCPVGTTIQEGDRVTQGSNTYDVRFIEDRNVGNEAHLHVILEKNG